MKKNKETIKNFGDEWKKFSQSNLTNDEIEQLYQRYFSIFPIDKLSNKSIGFDLGCGSGRFSKYLSEKVKNLHCIEPSDAINVAKINLSKHKNIIFHQISIEDMEFKENTMNFGICLGVLHHTHNIETGLKKCSSMLKKDSPFLIYLYYAFDNRPVWYFFLWKISNFLRKVISVLPKKIKFLITDILAATLYFPLAKISLICEKYLKLKVDNFPLNAYRNLSFYTMRTDSLDRFGTQIEYRYTKKQIIDLLTKYGFRDIEFSKKIPYWIAISYKK